MLPESVSSGYPQKVFPRSLYVVWWGLNVMST